MHSSARAILQYFDTAHLRGDAQAVSSKFHKLALDLTSNPACSGPELTVALRKLLEAKDAAVRSTFGGEG